MAATTEFEENITFFKEFPLQYGAKEEKKSNQRIVLPIVGCFHLCTPYKVLYRIKIISGHIVAGYNFSVCFECSELFFTEAIHPICNLLKSSDAVFRFTRTAKFMVIPFKQAQARFYAVIDKHAVHL